MITRRRALLARAVAGVAMAALLAGCLAHDPGDNAVHTTLADGSDLYLSAEIWGNIDAVSFVAYAHVPTGTTGELVVSGPVSWRCPGVFGPGGQASGGSHSFEDWPVFLVNGIVQSEDFAGPPGEYTFTLSVTSPIGSLSQSVNQPFHSAPRAPRGCHQTSGPASSPVPSVSGSAGP